MGLFDHVNHLVALTRGAHSWQTLIKHSTIVCMIWIVEFWQVVFTLLWGIDRHWHGVLLSWRVPLSTLCWHAPMLSKAFAMNLVFECQKVLARIVRFKNNANVLNDLISVQLWQGCNMGGLFLNTQKLLLTLRYRAWADYEVRFTHQVYRCSCLWQVIQLIARWL